MSPRKEHCKTPVSKVVDKKIKKKAKWKGTEQEEKPVKTCKKVNKRAKKDMGRLSEEQSYNIGTLSRF